MTRYLANINTRNRLTQIVILIIMILAGVLFSEVSHAQVSRQSHKKFDLRKYRTVVHSNAQRAVMVLHKKRNSTSKNPTFFASNKRPKTRQQQAETDEPSRVGSSN